MAGLLLTLLSAIVATTTIGAICATALSDKFKNF